MQQKNKSGNLTAAAFSAASIECNLWLRDEVQNIIGASKNLIKDKQGKNISIVFNIFQGVAKLYLKRDQ